MISARPQAASAGMAVVLQSASVSRSKSSASPRRSSLQLRSWFLKAGALANNGRTRPLNEGIRAFALCDLRLREREALEMAHRDAQDGDRRNARYPQTLERAVEPWRIALARHVADFLDARFGFVAHDGAHIFKRHALAAVHIEQQFFHFAPRGAPARAQQRNCFFQRIRRNGRTLRLERRAQQLGDRIGRIEITGDGCGVRLLRSLAQA